MSFPFDDPEKKPERRKFDKLTIALIVMFIVIIVVAAFGPRKAKGASTDQAVSRWVKVNCPVAETKKVGSAEVSVYRRCILRRADAVNVGVSSNAGLAVNTALRCPGYHERDIVSFGPPGQSTMKINRNTHPGLYAVMHASGTCTMYIIMIPVVPSKKWNGSIKAVTQLQRPVGL